MTCSRDKQISTLRLHFLTHKSEGTKSPKYTCTHKSRISAWRSAQYQWDTERFKIQDDRTDCGHSNFLRTLGCSNKTADVQSNCWIVNTVPYAEHRPSMWPCATKDGIQGQEKRPTVNIGRKVRYWPGTTTRKKQRKDTSPTISSRHHMISRLGQFVLICKHGKNDGKNHQSWKTRTRRKDDWTDILLYVSLHAR